MDSKTNSVHKKVNELGMNKQREIPSIRDPLTFRSEITTFNQVLANNKPLLGNSQSTLKNYTCTHSENNVVACEKSNLERYESNATTKTDQIQSSFQIKRYSRTLSENSLGFQPVSTSAKLKRILSAKEFRTRLAGCPQGLLIATEAPTSGQSYRRRANTGTTAAFGKGIQPRLFNSNFETGESWNDSHTSQLQEKSLVLVELEEVKRERVQLQKENERLQEELENRNKVIDHLIDFMKSNLPEGTQQFGENLTETSTNSNNVIRRKSFENV